MILALIYIFPELNGDNQPSLKLNVIMFYFISPYGENRKIEIVILKISSKKCESAKRSPDWLVVDRRRILVVVETPSSISILGVLNFFYI